MEFGSDATFRFIMDNINDETNTEWYDTLCASIRKDALKELHKNGLSVEDREDIVQEVLITVIQRLSEFCLSSAENTPAQRNSWLRAIIRSRLNDHFRRNARNPDASLDDDNLVEPASSINVGNQVVYRTELYDAIRKLGHINTSPDRAMAFLLNKLGAASSGKNGVPKQVSNELKGATLRDVFEEMKMQTATFLGEPVPDDVFIPLWRKVAPVANNLFSLTPRKITDSSNTIQEKYRNEAEGVTSDV